MTELTLTSLKAILGREVEDACLTVAKASSMGLPPETIANSMGLELTDIEDLMKTQDYKDVRLLVGSQMLQDKTERDSNWDNIEGVAVSKLHKRVQLENDTEMLLKIAAIANRAQRRAAPPKESGPLDPSQAGARIPLTLTRRYTEKLNGDGSMERSETQQISVLNGSAVNPKFEDIREMLNQGAQPQRAELGHKQVDDSNLVQSIINELGTPHPDRREGGPSKMATPTGNESSGLDRSANQSFTSDQLLAAIKRK